MFHHDASPTGDRPARSAVRRGRLGSDDLAANHTDDTYDAIDPDSLPERLARAGIDRIDVRTNVYGRAVIACNA